MKARAAPHRASRGLPSFALGYHAQRHSTVLRTLIHVNALAFAFPSNLVPRGGNALLRAVFAYQAGNVLLPAFFPARGHAPLKKPAVALPSEIALLSMSAFCR
jgi:hypothetical protein